MYISDVKKEFYDYLMGKHVVIFVHHDIDALCSCRILQTLIKFDRIQYTVAGVRGLRDLRAAYREHQQQAQCFVLLNCGGTVDLVEELQPADEHVLFVLDAHRPTDVCNVYSDGQVRLLWTADADPAVPDFDDIFRDDDEDSDGDVGNEASDEDDDETDASEGRAAKRRRLGEEGLLRRRERRQWTEARNRKMFEYTQYSYYHRASAMTLFELAHTLAKDSKELVWLAAVAVTEQHVLGKVESSQYAVVAGALQLELARVNRRTGGGGGGDGTAVSGLRVAAEEDLRLALHRHWSVEQSLTCSAASGAPLRLWSRRGARRLQELLVDMGLPLAQSRLRYPAMALAYRREFRGALARCGPRHGLADLAFPSFTARHGYHPPLAAADVVYAALAHLEQAPRTRSADACFSDTLDCLTAGGCGGAALVGAGLERAQVALTACFRSMRAALDQRAVRSAGPFLYHVLAASAPDVHLFARPHTLRLLAAYVQRAHAERHGPRAAAMPLVLSAPLDAAAAPALDEPCLLLGLPPLCENSPKNFFGKAFEQAVERSNATASLDYFDTSYIQLRTADRTRFLDSLAALLS